MKHLIWPAIILALFVGYHIGRLAERYRGNP